MNQSSGCQMPSHCDMWILKAIKSLESEQPDRRSNFIEITQRMHRWKFCVKWTASARDYHKIHHNKILTFRDHARFIGKSALYQLTYRGWTEAGCGSRPVRYSLTFKGEEALVMWEKGGGPKIKWEKYIMNVPRERDYIKLGDFGYV